MLFLSVTLLLVTLLLCYAGYIFLVVDRRTEDAVLNDPELYDALDDKNYNFELPEQVDTYEDLRAEEEEPADKCALPPPALPTLRVRHRGRPALVPSRHTRSASSLSVRRRTLPLALLERAKADIPMIEQLEKDHPRMARLFQKGLLPFGVWEQLLEAETLMDQEVNSVQAEAERLQKGWGAGVFSQAYQMLRKDREDELRAEAAARDAATLTLTFTKLSGGVVKLTADGRKVTQQTQLVLRKESATEEIAFKSEVVAELKMGAGDEAREYSCKVDELVLDAAQEKQWKQVGSDPTGLRLQVRFVKKTAGARDVFHVADVRATIPEAAGALAIGATAPPAPKA